MIDIIEYAACVNGFAGAARRVAVAEQAMRYAGP
jgi:hypothetical protein